MSDTENQENEVLANVEEESEFVETYNEVDKRDIVPTKKELKEEMKQTRTRLPPSEKQILARKANTERLLIIQKQKKDERERLKLENEKKMVAEMKEKWKKEYEKEQARKLRVENKKSTEMVKLPETQKLARVKTTPKPKPKPKPKPDEEEEEEEEDEEEEEKQTKPFIKRVIPKPKKRYVESDADSTDTEIIKDKLKKVKEIDAVLQPRVVNPYMRLLEKYYK